MPKYHFDIEQGSDEWFRLRLGRLTSTKAEGILVNGKNDLGIGVGFATNLKKIIAEKLTGWMPEPFSNQYTERGHENEYMAIHEYEMQTFQKVETVGFVTEGDLLGDSPDGLIGDDGIIEVKTRLPDIQLGLFLNPVVPKANIGQIHWHLFVTGRQWVDYVSYCPEYDEDSPLRLITLRVNRDEDMIIEIGKRVANAQKYIDQIMERCKEPIAI